MFDEFKPKRPQIQGDRQTAREDKLSVLRLVKSSKEVESPKRAERDLARAIEMAKQSPGVKQMLGMKDSQIGLYVDNGQTFLPTGEISWHASTEPPVRSIEDFKKINVMSVNVGRFGEAKNVESSKANFLRFIRDSFLNGGHVLTLQDFRYDRDKDVLIALKEMGLDYVANVFGQSKDQDGKFMDLANVTIINPKMFKGFKLHMPDISITPSFQRVKRDGKYVNAEPRWDLNYANEENYLRRNHFAFQALNTEIIVEGVDGSLPLNVGNIYNAPSSQIVDRIKSNMHSIKNIATSKGFQVLTGDFNAYGLDSARDIFGKPAFPIGIGVHTVWDMFRNKLPEQKFLMERLRRQGYYQLSKIGWFGKGRTIWKKGVLGLQVDGAITRKDLKTSSKTLKVPFTDHRVLVTTISL